MSNKYTYSVPFTEKEVYDLYVNQKMTQCEIASRFGTTQKVVWRAMRRMGVPTRVAAKRNQMGPMNSSWQGGRVLVAKTKRHAGYCANFGNGYFYILDPSHPNANKSGYVAEHIVVATNRRGKHLQTGELVHHINLNRHDNNADNLVIADAKTHAVWHNQIQKIAASLIAKGLIVFDPTSGYCLR